MSEFVTLWLTFAADFLQRVGEVENDVFLAHLDELHGRAPSMADACQNIAHCTVSFLTDTTSMKLIAGLSGGITQDALYNTVLGQTILPEWRKLEKLGPFTVA